MAILKGILPIEGTIGNITFARTRDGNIVREKGGVSAQRIASDPAFRRTRENNAEFGRAGRADRLFNNALRNTEGTRADARATSRLIKTLMTALKEDSTHPRGERTVAAGNLGLLAGFEFNGDGPLHATLQVASTTNVARSLGELKLDLPAFRPTTGLRAPEGTTHFRIAATLVETDFDAGTLVIGTESSAELPWNDATGAPLTLAPVVTPGTVLPLFGILSVFFSQKVGSIYYPLHNGTRNPSAIVVVDTV
jgi:hypothetical protein